MPIKISELLNRDTFLAKFNSSNSEILLQGPKEKKSTSERAELVKFFVSNLKNKKGGFFPPKRIAIALSHIPTKDLYFMQSVMKDIINRSGAESAQKWFWWSLRPQ